MIKGDYVLSCKSKRLYISNLRQLYTAFLHSIKLSGYSMRIKFDRHTLAVEENNYTAEIVNTYIAYDLHAWSRNPTNNFKLKNCLFGATNIIKNSDKEKWVYSGYGIAFDGAGSWNFGNDFTRNVKIFGVENSSPSHDGNQKDNSLVLGEGPTYDINGTFGSPEKKVSY